jgi:hypothetical protein
MRRLRAAVANAAPITGFTLLESTELSQRSPRTLSRIWRAWSLPGSGFDEQTRREAEPGILGPDVMSAQPVEGGNQ